MISDVGLLFAKKDIAPEDVLYNSLGLNDFKVGLVENYVCGKPTAIEYVCYYRMS